MLGVKYLTEYIVYNIFCVWKSLINQRYDIELLFHVHSMALSCVVSHILSTGKHRFSSLCFFFYIYKWGKHNSHVQK